MNKHNRWQARARQEKEAMELWGWIMTVTAPFVGVAILWRLMG